MKITEKELKLHSANKNAAEFIEAVKDKICDWISYHNVYVPSRDKIQVLFHCDSCHKNSLLDTYDVLTVADGLHCPLCGDNAEHLTVANEEINLNFKLEDVKKFGVTFNDASKVFKDFRKGGH